MHKPTSIVDSDTMATVIYDTPRSQALGGLMLSNKHHSSKLKSKKVFVESEVKSKPSTLMNSLLQNIGL